MALQHFGLTVRHWFGFGTSTEFCHSHPTPQRDMFLSICPFVVERRGETHAVMDDGSRINLSGSAVLVPEMNLTEIEGQGLINIIRKVHFVALILIYLSSGLIDYLAL